MPQQQQFSGNPFLLGDSERGSYDYSGMTPEEAQTQRNIAQRRQMAKLMMYQGQQQAGKKGGMVGNIYVKASPMEGLAGMGQIGLGGLADYFLNKESTEETKKQATARKARIDEYIAATTDTPALPASKPLRPESFGESNLNQIIRETNPEQASQLGPRDIPTPSLRPMNKVSQTMMDMQVKAPQRLSPEQEKFALRFGEGPQDPFAGGMMGDGSGPAVAGTPYQPGAYTPKEIGPETPGTPGITRSQGDIQRAGLKAFAYGDPRLDKLVGHVTDQRNQQEQAKLTREDRIARDTQANLDRVSRDETLAFFQRELEKQRQAGQRDLKGTVSGDTDPNNKTRIEVANINADSRENAAKMKTGAGRPLSATAQKELIQTDEDLQSGYQVIQSLKSALAINDKAMGFLGAGVVGSVGSLLPESMRPKAVDATNELDNIISGSALSQLKLTFGGNPTEGERKILLDIQGSSNKSPAVRKEIYGRATKAVEARMKFNIVKAKNLRDGSYFNEQGAPGFEFGDAPISPAGGKPKAGGKTVVKTGTVGDKKVVQYSDGSVDYAN